MHDDEGEWTPAPNLDRVAYFVCMAGLVLIVLGVLFAPDIRTR